MTRSGTPGLWHNKVAASSKFARCHYSEQKLGGRRKWAPQHVCAREQCIPRRASRQRDCRGHIHGLHEEALEEAKSRTREERSATPPPATRIIRCAHRIRQRGPLRVTSHPAPSPRVPSLGLKLTVTAAGLFRAPSASRGAAARATPPSAGAMPTRRHRRRVRASSPRRRIGSGSIIFSVPSCRWRQRPRCGWPVIRTIPTHRPAIEG